jgi:hypothetical protein
MRTTEGKIDYLRKLLKIYLKFSRHYTEVDLKISGKSFMVLWSQPKILPWYDFEQIECPLEDLDTRIISYKGKLNREFKKRNNLKIK